MIVRHPSYWAEHTPDKPALVLVDDGAVLTYRQLVARSARAAGFYVDLGVREGETVAFLIENQIRYAELAWAAKNSGLRYVAVSTHLNAADAAYIIEDCGAKLLVTSSRLAPLATEVSALLKSDCRLAMVDGAAPGFEDYDARLDDCQPVSFESRRRGASMLYSSGTTGRPKGVKTTIADVPPTTPPHRFALIVEQFDFNNQSVFINPGPFYHAGPLRFMMTIHRCGGTVIGFRKFDPEVMLRAIENYRGTHGFFVPTMFRRMLGLDDAIRKDIDLSSMKHAIHAAAPCPIDLKRAMIDWWGPVIDELYSGTESVGHTFITSEEWLRHPGAVGRAASNCQIRIVDEDGAELPTGVPGRIEMANGMEVEYYGAAANARLYTDDGYASLGDIGYLDEDGYLYLTDRESHMIIVGGVNIYPQEAENTLLKHPLIADVAVIGVPNKDMGEEVKAIVELEPSACRNGDLQQELIDFCRERLSLMKCPRTIDFVERLPRNDLGKLAKHKLRERYWRKEERLI